MNQTGIVFNIQKFSIHDGPGIRTTVFLKGCPLRCAWCANPESQSPCIEKASDGALYGKQYTAQEVMAQVRQDKPFYDESGGGMTLSGGEPLFQADFACAILEQAKAEGIHTAVETTGGVPFGSIEPVIPFTDLFLYDLKHYDSKRHREGTGIPLENILNNLKRILKANGNAIIRIPVIPGFNDTPADAENFSTLIKSLGAERVDLLPFHQFGEKKYSLLDKEYQMGDVPALHAEDLQAYQKVFLNHGLACKI